MKLKKIGAALLAILALAAVAASSSSAAVTTTRAEWYTGASPGTTLAGSAKVNKVIEVREHPEIGKKFRFTTTIAGEPVELTSTEGECVECKVENKEITSKAGAAAYGEGRILFKNVTVDKPATTCTVTGETGVGQVTTKPLVIHADWMDKETSNQKAFVQFLPSAGATTTFAQFELGGTGCGAVSGLKNVKGTVFGESVKNTGEFSKVQGLVFSAKVQETAEAALNVGGVAATLTGTAGFSLESGAEYAIK